MDLKIKIKDIAEGLNISSKDIVSALEEIGVQGKKTVSAVDQDMADLILGVFIKKTDNGLDVLEIFKDYSVATPVVQTQNQPKKEKMQKLQLEPIEDGEIITAEVVAKQSRHIDTRAADVDLEKFDNEKIAELVDEMKDQDTKMEKFKKGAKGKKTHQVEEVKVVHKEKPKAKIEIIIPDPVAVSMLGEKLSVPATEIIKRLMMLGTLATINDEIDFETASLIADDLNAIAIKEIIVTAEDILFNDMEDDEKDLVARPPIVVVMGHVDHGKTSLLDTIRNTNVTASESGGITQHIGAYSVRAKGRDITFLDTPGHEAFTSMRARGAQVTDVAVIVISADDGIMPQTIEAINHVKEAGVSLIIAINKIDKENANVERVKQELTEHNLVPEEWGGDTICMPVSATKKIGIEELLEMILLVADMKDLKANPNRNAKGTVIEARLDKGRGPVSTLLVQNGTLRVGDYVVAGTCCGKVRTMTNYKGEHLKKAPPGTPVEITGLSEVPAGGDIFYIVNDERMAKQVIEKRKQEQKESVFKANKRVSLDDLFEQINQGEVKDLNIIVKADVQGSVEAIKSSLEKISNDEVRVRVIHGAVGAVNESDVMLAEASNAIVVGFNVRPTMGATEQAADKGVDVRLYRVIYDAIEEIEDAMKGMLTPKYKETILGHAEVREVYKITGVGAVSGCYITDGKVMRNAQVRIIRDGIVLFEGGLTSLKRFKDDAKEVATGYECGITVERYNDIKQGDVLECFMMEEIER